MRKRDARNLTRRYKKELLKNGDKTYLRRVLSKRNNLKMLKIRRVKKNIRIMEEEKDSMTRYNFFYKNLKFQLAQLQKEEEKQAEK